VPVPNHRILFVCSGNTSRSVMAAAWFNAACRERGLAGLEAEAAGINSPDGAPIAPEAMAVLEERHILPERLGSRRLTAKAVLRADLVVAMTEQHRERLVEAFPRLHLRVVALMAFAKGGDRQVADPVGGGVEAYRACLDQMQPALEAILDEWA